MSEASRTRDVSVELGDKRATNILTLGALFFGAFVVRKR